MHVSWQHTKHECAWPGYLTVRKSKCGGEGRAGGGKGRVRAEVGGGTMSPRHLPSVTYREQLAKAEATNPHCPRHHHHHHAYLPTTPCQRPQRGRAGQGWVHGRWRRLGREEGEWEGEGVEGKEGDILGRI